MPDAHAPLPALAVGYRLPDPAADLDGYLGHALLGSVLGDGEAARLQRRLVHADGLVTDVSAGAGLMGPLDARDPDTFTVTAVHPAAVDPDRVLDALDEELDKLAAEGPTDEELRRQVARWSAALYQENDRVMYRMLGLGARELLYGRAEIAVELPERLAAVTPEQVRAAAAALCAAAVAASCSWSPREVPRDQDRRGDRPHRRRPPPAARARRRPARSRCPTWPTPSCPTGCGCSPRTARASRWSSCACGCRSRATRPSTRPSPSCSRRPCSPAPRPATASRSTTSWPRSAPTSASASTRSG